jgi:hypothetical protein
MVSECFKGVKAAIDNRDIRPVRFVAKVTRVSRLNHNPQLQGTKYASDQKNH